MNRQEKIQEMKTRLHAVTCCNAYIVGVAIDGNVYACFCNDIDFGLKLSTTSKKNGDCYAVRFRPSNADKKKILENSYKNFYLCKQEVIEEQYNNTKYSRGEIFEKLITEYYGFVWVKDNKRIDKAPDIEVNNIKYSVKYQQAEYANEKTLTNIENGK